MKALLFISIASIVSLTVSCSEPKPTHRLYVLSQDGVARAFGPEYEDTIDCIEEQPITISSFCMLYTEESFEIEPRMRPTFEASIKLQKLWVKLGFKKDS